MRITAVAPRAFEEEAGFYDAEFTRGQDRVFADESPLEGLPDSDVILSGAGRALVAALTACVVVSVLLQWLGLR